MVSIRNGDKLYLVTRRDISPGYQAVQSCHAIRQFSEDHPEIDDVWFKASNYLALLSVEDEVELTQLLEKAQDMGLRCSSFFEPDVNQITAIAIEPHPKARSLCSELQLALS
jgi:peptidyl-tRNA hydrolase